MTNRMHWQPFDPTLNANGDNCGTGAGGFKKGNTCGGNRRRGRYKTVTPEQAIRHAFEHSPNDPVNAAAMADYYEEQGNVEVANLIRRRPEFLAQAEDKPIYYPYLWETMSTSRGNVEYYAHNGRLDRIEFDVLPIDRMVFPEIPSNTKTIKVKVYRSGDYLP